MTALTVAPQVIFRFWIYEIPFRNSNFLPEAVQDLELEIGNPSVCHKRARKLELEIPISVTFPIFDRFPETLLMCFWPNLEIVETREEF